MAEKFTIVDTTENNAKEDKEKVIKIETDIVETDYLTYNQLKNEIDSCNMQITQITEKKVELQRKLDKMVTDTGIKVK